MSYGLNYLRLCYFSFQRETSLFLECGWQTHTLFYGEVSLCLGLKPFLFHQLSWWFFFTQVLNKKRRIVQNDAANWWTRRGSNPRPLGCEPNALPAELRAHVVDLTTIPQQGKIVKLVLKKVRRCCSAWKSGRRTPGKRDPGSRQRPLSCLPGQEYCAGCKAEVWKHAAAFAGIKQFRAIPHNSRLTA